MGDTKTNELYIQRVFKIDAMIRKEWLIIPCITIIVLCFMYHAERLDCKRLEKKLQEVEVITETPLEENKEIKEITTDIDSLKHDREELKKDYESKISIYVTNDVDSLIEFFEGYVSKYRLGKSVGE